MSKKSEKKDNKLTDKEIEFYIKDEQEAYETYLAIYKQNPKKYKYFKTMALQEKAHNQYLVKLLKRRKSERSKKKNA